jgi:hypothetical protein
MRTKIALMSSLAALGALLPAAAFAEENPVSAPAAAEAVAAPAAWPGWIRIDSDTGALQLWAGATAPLADGIGLAFDMYVNSGFMGEFDIGPAITAGPFIVTPMLGAQFDWRAHTFAALVPQLYVTGGPAPIYSELWLQYYNYNTVYKYREKVDPVATNTLYMRLFVDYKINDYIGVGPQIELKQDFTASEMTSLPIGANVFFFQAGANSTFQAFLGYETKKKFYNDNALAGRLSYVHNF